MREDTMELISYEQFRKLRMRQFVPPNTEVFEEHGWEWMGGLWTYEAIGFTGIARYEEMPDEAGGLEIDFSELPESAPLAMLKAVQLPLSPGMRLDQVRSILGEPQDTESFTADRKTYVFTVGAQNPYYVSCTVHDKDGLIFVSVIRKDVLRKCDECQAELHGKKMRTQPDEERD